MRILGTSPLPHAQTRWKPGRRQCLGGGGLILGYFYYSDNRKELASGRTTASETRIWQYAPPPPRPPQIVRNSTRWMGFVLEDLMEKQLT